MNTKRDKFSKAGKLTSVIVAAMLIFVTFAAVDVTSTDVTNNNAPADWVKASETYVLVMNFTVTTYADTLLAGVNPSVGQILESTGQSEDWGNSSVGTAVILCHSSDGTGDYDWTTDCIWQENATFPNTNYNSIDTVLNGTAPAEDHPSSFTGARHPLWTSVKTYDAVNGNSWNAVVDSIFFENGANNNNCYLDELNAVTFNLSSTCNATASDITDVTLWVETAGAGFSSSQDTFIGNGTLSGNSTAISSLTRDINTAATFYVAVNISGAATHWRNIVMEIPSKLDANSDGAYNAGDRGLFLAGTNDTGGVINANAQTIDTNAPLTSVDTVNATKYWMKAADNATTITATIYDAPSGIATVALYYYWSNDNSSWGGATLFGTDSTPWPASWSFNFLNGSGYYRFYSIGTDNASNTEAVPGVNDTEFGFDTTYPDTTITAPTDGGKYKTLSNITGTATDTYSGVASVTITIFNSTDGTYWTGSAWGASSTPLTCNGTTAWYYENTLAFPTWTSAKSYIINSTAVDAAANTESAADSNSFTFDTTAPTVIISVPAHTTWYKTMTNISGTAADTDGAGVSTVNITIYNSTGGTWWNGSSNLWGAWNDVYSWMGTNGTTAWYNDSDIPTFSNGSTYVVNAAATDAAGNIGVNDSNTFYYDTDGVESSATALSQYWITSAPLTISYTANDYGSGLANVTLYYRYSTDNASWGGWTAWVDVSNPDTTPYITRSWSFNFPSESGYYEFYTRATDNVSNVEAAPGGADTRCAYDIVNPTAAITLPANGGMYKTGMAISTNITGTAYDVQGATTVKVYIYNQTGNTYWDGSVWQSTALNLSANISGGIPTTNWWYENTLAYPTWTTSNVYRINLSCSDAAGNWNQTAATSYFIFDNTNPSVTMLVPGRDWYNSMGTISGTCSDTGGSGINRVNLTIYNVSADKYWNSTSAAWEAASFTITTTLGGGYSTWSWTSSGVTWFNGTQYLVNATAMDNSTNIGSTDSNSFTYDDQTPTSAAGAIATYWQTTTPLTITHTSNDFGSGLGNVTLYYKYSNDNSSFGAWTSFTSDMDPYITMSFSFNFPSGSGFYQFCTRADDNATNNESAPGSPDTTCGYDASNPTATISVPADGEYYNSMNQISGTCSDTGYSGIYSVNITIFNVTSSKYWNGTDWANPVTWLVTTLNSGYTTWSNNSTGIPWFTGNQYMVNATAIDNASRTSTVDSNTFNYITTRPTVTIEYGSSATYFKDADTLTVYANFTEAGSGMNENTIKITIDTAGTDVTSATMTKVDNTHWTYAWNVPAASDGNVNVSIDGQDNVSQLLFGVNYSTSKYIDNTAPTITIEYGSSATYFKDADTLTVYANFTEAGSGILETTVKISIDTSGSDITPTAMSKVDNTHWTYAWNVPAASDGNANVSVEVMDNVSLSVSAATNYSTTKYIDNTAPTVAITYGSSATYFGDNDTVTVYANFTEAGSGILESTVKITVDTTGTDVTPTAMSKVDNTHWTYSWNVPAASDGNVNVSVEGTDNMSFSVPASGNYSTTKYIDNTNPTVSIEYSSAATYFQDANTLTVYANFTEAGSGILESTVKITVDTTGTDVTPTAMSKVDNTHWTYSWNVPAASDGNVNISVEARDNVSQVLSGINWSTSKYIDNTAPTVSIAYGSSATYFKDADTLTVFANITEAGSGILETTVKISIDTSGTDVTPTAMAKVDNTHWTYAWNVPAASDGNANVSVEASDNVSLAMGGTNWSTTKYVDNTNPSGDIGAPTNGGYYEILTNITGNATDALSGVNNARITIYNSTNNFYWSGTTWVAATTYLNANTSGTGTSITWWYENTLAYPTWTNGNSYAINLTVIDTAGNNNSAVDSNSFTYDTGGPTISNVVITDGTIGSTAYVKNGDSVNITATVTDVNLVSGDQSYIKANLTGFGYGAAVAADAYDGTTAYWNKSSVTCTPGNGTVTVTINASDKAYNYATEVSDTITSDNALPTLSYAVFDADYNGNTRTYIDVYFSELTMNASTADTTDFSISTSGVTVSAVESSSNDRITINLSAKLDGGGPTLSIAGNGIQDLAGNILSSGTVTINTYRISLISGWNMFSIPGDVSTISIPTLLNSIWSSINTSYNIWWYNGSSDSWKYYNVGLQSGTLSAIEPGKAYWINMNTSATLIGNYSTVLHGINPAPIITLTGHAWNMIGSWPNYNQTASDTGGLASLSDVLDSTGEILYKYTSSGGFVNIYGSSTVKMQPGDGFWIYIKTSSNGYYTIAES